MENFFYKIKLLILRILGYEKPLRVALLKYLSLKFTTFRPHYETLVYETSKNALKLGYDEINIFFNSYINSLLFYVMMISMLLHSKLGLQTIVDDYVTSKKISKNIKRALNINAYMLMILITIFIVRNIL